MNRKYKSIGKHNTFLRRLLDTPDVYKKTSERRIKDVLCCLVFSMICIITCYCIVCFEAGLLFELFGAVVLLYDEAALPRPQIESSFGGGFEDSVTVVPEVE